MNDSTKTLVGTVAGLAALVAIFAIMAQCTQAVSRTGSDAVAACLRSGGQWLGRNGGRVTDLNFCSYPDKRK